MMAVKLLQKKGLLVSRQKLASRQARRPVLLFHVLVAVDVGQVLGSGGGQDILAAMAGWFDRVIAFGIGVAAGPGGGHLEFGAIGSVGPRNLKCRLAAANASPKNAFLP